MGHLLVIGDSLAFHGPERSERPSDPRLYPQVAGRILDADVDLVARQGWTARDAWWALTKDPVVWGEYLPRADAMLIGVGGMDQLPTPVPTWLRESIPYVRDGRIRRTAREMLKRVTPPMARAVGGPFRTLPQAATDRYLTRVVEGVRMMRPGLPIALLSPPPWTGAYYPSRRAHAPALAAARAWAVREGVAYVDVEPLVRSRLTTINPDGMHWSWEVHALVGAAVAESFRGVTR
ncbi:MAG: GDSL-type esterase/lipase family protein [Candidatus Nanopelagicales bacterium]